MRIPFENAVASRALSWLSTSALLVGLVACGGGGGGAEPVEPPPPAAPGSAASASIGADGGSLAFTANGVAGSLSIPPGALKAHTTLTVTPLAPAAGEWARVQIEGAVGVLEIPVTLTLQLPDAPGPAATGVVVEAGGALPLPSTRGADGRSLAIELQDFGEAATTTAAAAPGRVQALAVRPLASGPPPAPVAARMALTPQERLDALRRSIERHERELSVRSGLSSILAAVSVRQMIGEVDNAAAALRELEQARDRVCTKLRVALMAAEIITVPADLNARDENESQRWIFGAMAPVLYWQAVAQQLGGEPCSGADVDAVFSAKWRELLNWVRTRTTQLNDAVGFGQVLRPVPQAATLASHAVILRAPALGRTVKTTFVEPAMLPLRTMAWDTATASQAHYQPVLSQLDGQYTAPFQDDVQLSGTTLRVGSYSDLAATQIEGSATMGRQATPQSSVKAWTVSAKAGGKIGLDGPIQVLKCPSPASERLVVTFEGTEVLNQASAGDLLLQGSLGFEVNRLLNAAGIQPANATQHVLKLWRKASSCNAAFGLGDAAVAEVTLDFSKACRPAVGATHCVTRIEAAGQPVQMWQARWMNKLGTVHFLTSITSGVDQEFLPWIWQKGRLTQLPRGFGATAMNNLDTLVGSAPMAAPLNAGNFWRSPAIWRPSAYTVLDLPGQLHDVNDADTAVGAHTRLCNPVLNPNQGPSFSTPLRVRNGSAVIAPLPPTFDADHCRSTTWSYLGSINNLGQECEIRHSSIDGSSGDCVWINDGGRQAWLRPELLLANGMVLPGNSLYVHARLGNWHASDIGRQQVVDMRTGADMPVPVLPAGSGLESGDAAPGRWLWVDDLGRVLVQPGLLTGAVPSPAFILTPSGTERP